MATIAPPSSYPRKVQIQLTVELDILSQEEDGYIFASPADSAVLQLGFLADLFDILRTEGSLGVQKINGFTQQQIAKTLSGL